MMTTEILGGTDLDWLELIDYEKEITCQNVSVSCDKLAEWQVIGLCCNKSLLMCTKHKDNELWWYKNYKPNNCSFCKNSLVLKILPL